uniref:Uncharacterized protein n=1 Tax=Eutreptiella gymnastica TaxID=73025 RepID=A0A7S4G0E6_9EUGL
MGQGTLKRAGEDRGIPLAVRSHGATSVNLLHSGWALGQWVAFSGFFSTTGLPTFAHLSPGFGRFSEPGKHPLKRGLRCREHPRSNSRHHVARKQDWSRHWATPPKGRMLLPHAPFLQVVAAPSARATATPGSVVTAAAAAAAALVGLSPSSGRTRPMPMPARTYNAQRAARQMAPKAPPPVACARARRGRGMGTHRDTPTRDPLSRLPDRDPPARAPGGVSICPRCPSRGV